MTPVSEIINLQPAPPAEAKPADGLTDAQRRLVELDLRKPEIKAYYEELEQTVAAVAAEVGVDGYFAAPDGTVYKLVSRHDGGC